ncbi:MAG: TonB-dependent receptor [Candidatus Omnitrophica bacterium]|nr:TonB-dependent receptor [Candidatus Omnitrophota bacterium]
MNGFRLSLWMSAGILIITQAPGFADNLMNESLQELLNTTVTSASGREQNLNDVANAMYVITREDIERSGARNVADLLYRVPGLDVRQIDGHQYGVDIRGNAGYTTNNLLVLIDGAVVFNPMIGGVLWENLPVSLNEIERIEIIRGSPGVLYSSNAVNGVINIITKSADIKDNYVQQQGGTQSYRDSSIGIGESKIGQTGLAFRAYLDNRFDQGFTKNAIHSYSDRYLSDVAGGRVDYTPSDHQHLSIIGSSIQQNSNSPNVVTGAETKTPGETSMAIINYTDKASDRYDYSFHFDHVEQLGTAFDSYDAIVHTTSANTQHNFHYDLWGHHVTSVGGELRYNDLHVAEDRGVAFQGLVTNGTASQKIISFFAQDEYRPIEKLVLTAGVREDSNSLVINEKPLYSPKVSALYHLTDTQTVWASSSQTYRTPDFIDHDLSITAEPGVLVYRGSTHLKPEENFTQEAGYRGLFLDDKLRADATIFMSRVNDLIVLNGNTGITANDGSLTSQGAELSLDYQFTDALSFSTDYSYIYPHAKPETANFPDIVSYDTDLSNNIVGLGLRYTKNNLKIDVYAKYFEGYVVQEDQGFPPSKVRGYYKSFFRVSYDFLTPRWVGKNDATVYLEVSDFLGARRIESTYVNTSSAVGSNEIFIKPEVTAGIKIKF